MCLQNLWLFQLDEEKLRWSFRLYDMDNNGVIDMEEMIVIIETLDSIEGVKPGEEMEKEKEMLEGVIQYDESGNPQIIYSLYNLNIICNL